MPPAHRGARRRALPRVLVLAAVLGIAAPGHAAPAPPVLRGTVVVSATTTGYADVTLPRPMTLAATPAFSATADTVTALALVKVQGGAEPPGVAVLHLPGTAEWQYVWVGRSGGGTADPRVGHTRTLPAGRYRLFVRTFGPASVTWRLPLPGGRTTVAARTGTGWTYADATATGARGTAVAPGYAVEQTGTARHRGLVLGVLWWDASTDATGHFGGCTYQGESSPAELGPAPACLAGDGFVGPVVPFAGRSVGLMDLYVAPGTWTDKEYVRVFGVARDGGVSSSLLDLGPGFPAA